MRAIPDRVRMVAGVAGSGSGAGHIGGRFPLETFTEAKTVASARLGRRDVPS
jgi:hypothetical protein